MKQKEQQTTKTTTKTVEKKKKEARQPYDFLEPEEEKVIRMRYGLSEKDDKYIEYALGASQDSKSRLTLMEIANIDELDADVPIAQNADPEKLKNLVDSINQ